MARLNGSSCGAIRATGAGSGAGGTSAHAASKARPRDSSPALNPGPRVHRAAVRANVASFDLKTSRSSVPKIIVRRSMYG